MKFYFRKTKEDERFGERIAWELQKMESNGTTKTTTSGARLFVLSGTGELFLTGADRSVLLKIYNIFDDDELGEGVEGGEEKFDKFVGAAEQEAVLEFVPSEQEGVWKLSKLQDEIPVFGVYFGKVPAVPFKAGKYLTNCFSHCFFPWTIIYRSEEE